MLETGARRPRRIVARTLGLGISTLVAAGLLTWTPAATTGWSQGAAESTLWQLMNGARLNNGVAPVQSHGTLVGLARWRSSDMLAKNYFSHTIAGCGCLVYVYYDSSGLAYDWAGENIGWNSGRTDAESPVRVHEQFMGSAGHRANVLDARFTHGGVGAAAADGKMFQGYVQNTRMYTELFMQASGGGSCRRRRSPLHLRPVVVAAAAERPPLPRQPQWRRVRSRSHGRSPRRCVPTSRRVRGRRRGSTASLSSSRPRRTASSCSTCAPTRSPPRERARWM